MDSKHSLPELVEILEYANYISIREREEIAELITQQDKMIELAIDKLENGCCDAPESFDCDEVGMVCRDCWRKYLQGEVSK